MATIAPTVFDSFNARAVSAERLAEGFIPPEHFQVAIRRAHTLVIGPRGSGKTCLLKMLQPVALNAWKAADADAYKRRVDFSGIYIPADISWSRQLRYLGADRLQPSLREKLENAALTAHVLHAFVSAIIDRTTLTDSAIRHLHLKIPSKTERAVVETLGRRWKLTYPAPTLLSLKHALLGRANDVWRFALAESLDESAGKDRRFVQRGDLDFDFLHEVLFCIEVLDDLTRRKQDRWALLFDELEIAPRWMLERLISSFRSVGQKLLLKLTISPYTKISALSSPQGPQSGQDFDLIRLWYGYKQEGRAFCEKLFLSVLRANKINISNPEKILGKSPLKGGEDIRGSSYAKGSKHHKLLIQAYKADESFRSYCLRNKLDLDNIDKLSEEARASLIRKIVPTLMIRLAFRKPDKSGNTRPQLRSRKRPLIYSGADTFFEMLEGNPRWLIGILQDMLPEIKRTGKVSPHNQLGLIERTSDRFCTILNTIPLAPNSDLASKSLLDALNAVAAIIHESVVLSDFTSEPFGTFKVDKHTPKVVFDAIGTAINAGALVFQYSTEDEHLADELQGKRFRLAYLLSPHYQIPLRLSRPLQLSRAIALLKGHSGPESSDPDSANSLATEAIEQLELFR